MKKFENFNELVNQAMQNQTRSHMRLVIAKELLHYDILFALDNNGLLDDLTFQGGTSLRLCYGAQRFSEDLDFVGGHSFSAKELQGIKSCLQHYIGERYGLEIVVKEPKDITALSEFQDIKVDKWQIRITTSPGKKDLPKQKIKLEVANVPAYSRVPLSLQQNYNFLPDGYSDILVLTETIDEIMADKLVSLVSCQRYIRHRDIWDLRWLKQQGAKINSEFILAKITDYKVDNYSDKLNDMIERIDSIVRSKGFNDEMTRFIPLDVQERTLQKAKFTEFLINENKSLLKEVQKILAE